MNKMPILLESTALFDNFFSIRKDRLLYPNQCIADYYVLSTAKESVAIIATTAKGEIAVMQEYRHPVNKILLGCPGGLVDPNESFLDAAKRELLEETGCMADSFEVLGTCFPLPGILSQKMAVVLARNVHEVQAVQHDEMELIEWQFMPEQELKKRILSGDDVDAILCTAFLLYLLKA